MSDKTLADGALGASGPPPGADKPAAPGPAGQAPARHEPSDPAAAASAGTGAAPIPNTQAARPVPAPAPALRSAPPRLLLVRHDTIYHHQQPVELAHHSAHLRPRDTEVQQVKGWTLEIDPPPEQGLQAWRDVFGNWCHGFSHARVHQRLAVVSSFQVLALAPVDWAAEHSPPWDEVAAGLTYRAGVQQPEAAEFVLGSVFAPSDVRLRRFAPQLFVPGRPLLDLALALMAEVHGRVAYRPASTTVATDALQVLERAEGVCQDFAHLMIGVLRAHGLAARYVSGYLLTEPPPGQPRLVGADASHAWLAVWCPLHGWVALDPTNNVRVGQDHVTLAWGRDYADVAPLRGVVRGGTQAAPEVAVTVAPA